MLILSYLIQYLIENIVENAGNNLRTKMLKIGWGGGVKEINALLNFTRALANETGYFLGVG